VLAVVSAPISSSTSLRLDSAPSSAEGAVVTAATAAAVAVAAEPTAAAAHESESTASWTLKTADGEDATSDEEELQAEAVEEEVGCAAAEDARWSNKRCMSRCACANAPTLEASADTILEASFRTRCLFVGDIVS
jgi:hypothetical protein